MADLPKERIEPSPPFTYCGMDCFGPFIVKQGRKEIKRYGLLFTCMCSRAIHTEMLDDMSTDAFISGLRCLSPLEQLFDNCAQTKELTSLVQRMSFRKLWTKKE